MSAATSLACAPARRAVRLPSLLDDEEALRDLRAMMLRMATGRFRLQANDAEDVVQGAFLTFIEVRRRYAPEDHPAVLVGIVRKKCLAHRNRAEREDKKLRRLLSASDAARELRWLRPAERCVLDDLVRVESDRRIRETFEELRPFSRGLFAKIAANGFARRDLVAQYGLNVNTFDTRLRASRSELRRRLVAKDLAG